MLAGGAALLAAVCFAVASVLQHRTAARSPAATGLGVGLLLHLARRPTWLFGLLASAGGLALHAFALSAGRLVIVQPLLVCGMLFALPASVLLDRRRPSLWEWSYAGVVVTGLAVFLVASNPAAGTALADRGILGAATGVGTAAAAVAVLLAGTTARRQRAALLGLAGGIGFGLTGALLKQVVDQAGSAPLELLTTWPAYALVVIGIAGTVLVQSSYQAGSLAASLPPLTIADPVVAVIIGAAAFGETLAASGAAMTGQLGGLLLMGWGVLRLAARTQREAEQPTDAASQPPAGYRTRQP